MSKSVKEALKSIELRLAEISKLNLEPETSEQKRDSLLKEAEQLAVLRTSLRKHQMEPPKWDSIIGGGVSLVSVAMILKYEKFDIVTSRAISIATKLIGR